MFRCPAKLLPRLLAGGSLRAMNDLRIDPPRGVLLPARFPTLPYGEAAKPRCENASPGRDLGVELPASPASLSPGNAKVTIVRYVLFEDGWR